MPTKRWEKREREYPASIASDPLCPVTAHISKASYNTLNNTPRLKNTDSDPDGVNKTKQSMRIENLFQKVANKMPMFRKQKPTKTKTSSIFLPRSVCVHVYFSKYLGSRSLKSKDSLVSELSDNLCGCFKLRRAQPNGRCLCLKNQESNTRLTQECHRLSLERESSFAEAKGVYIYVKYRYIYRLCYTAVIELHPGRSAVSDHPLPESRRK